MVLIPGERQDGSARLDRIVRIHTVRIRQEAVFPAGSTHGEARLGVSRGPLNLNSFCSDEVGDCLVVSVRRRHDWLPRLGQVLQRAQDVYLWRIGLPRGVEGTEEIQFVR